MKILMRYNITNIFALSGTGNWKHPIDHLSIHSIVIMTKNINYSQILHNTAATAKYNQFRYEFILLISHSFQC